MLHAVLSVRSEEVQLGLYPLDSVGVPGFQKPELEGHEGNEEHEGLRGWEPFIVAGWLMGTKATAGTPKARKPRIPATATATTGERG